MNTAEVLAWLQQHGTRRVADGMARYGIVTADRVAGVSVGDLQKLGKRLGRDHALAAGLWASGWYEARMLAAFVDDPELVTRRQMNAWAADFDNWATCDHSCFNLFDRSPLAWEAAPQWAKSPREFVRRAGFALMACLALHDKTTEDDQFLVFLPLIERGAGDERNFVKKGVSWALRAIGRRSQALYQAAVAVARRLAESDEAAARWVGKDALRDLSKAKVRARMGGAVR
jgi:3-methyladenine DNA glycosylase AlkD